MSQRVIWVIVLSAITVCLSGQQKLRDRDPDLEGSKKIVDEIQQANFHLRSLYFSSRFRISDLGYSEGGYVPTSDQSGGFSLSVEAPQRLYYRPHRKVVFSVEAVPGYSFGRKGSNQFNYSSRGDVHLLFNHLYLDGYALGFDRLETHVADINSLATVRQKTVGVAGEMKYSSRTNALFNVSYGQTSYPTDRYQPTEILGDPLPVDLLDRDTRSARVSLNHKTFPKTSLFLAAEGNTYEFRKATYKDSNRLWTGGGFHWNSGRSQFRAEAGPVRLDFDDPTQEDYTGVSGEFNFDRTSGRWGFSLGADRDLGFSITSRNNFFVSTAAHAGLTFQATRKLTLRMNGARERDDYDVSLASGLRRQDTISFYSAGASYGLRRLRFGGDVGWYARDSTILAEEDSGIRYLVHLSFTP